MEDRNILLGMELKARRKAKGLTQAALASLVGVHEITIRRYEKAERSVDLSSWVDILACLGMDEDSARNLYFHVWQMGNTEADCLYKWQKTFEQEDEEFERNGRMQALNDAFMQLNAIGQAEAVNRVEEMTHIPKYTEGGEDHGSET